jgi:hypothetical protein
VIRVKATEVGKGSNDYMVLRKALLLIFSALFALRAFGVVAPAMPALDSADDPACMIETLRAAVQSSDMATEHGAHHDPSHHSVTCAYHCAMASTPPPMTWPFGVDRSPVALNPDQLSESILSPPPLGPPRFHV